MTVVLSRVDVHFNYTVEVSNHFIIEDRLYASCKSITLVTEVSTK